MFFSVKTDEILHIDVYSF